MESWPFERRQNGLALTRQFAILSFLVIGLMAAALSTMVTYALRRDLLDREWGTTADYIRTGILQQLSPKDFLQPGLEASRKN